MRGRIRTTDNRQEWGLRKLIHDNGGTPPIFIEVTNRRGTSQMAVHNPRRARL